jgi:hypothetical protein
VARPEPVIDYRGDFRFTVPREVLWHLLEDTGEFERWWGWLGEFRMDGNGLETGSVLTGVVTPPLPYHMRIQVVLEDCTEPASITAAVHGDLEGSAHLDLADDGDATIASVGWTIEMMQPPMRLAARVAYPVLRWGHDRVVDATVFGFRRRLAAERQRYEY